jgi:hypothetical protein
MVPAVASSLRATTVLAAVRQVSAFSHVTRAILRPLQGKFVPRTFDAGSQITALGQSVERFHVITVRGAFVSLGLPVGP